MENNSKKRNRGKYLTNIAFRFLLGGFQKQVQS